MNKLKEKLQTSLGIVGLILWYFIAITITCAPLFCVFRFNTIVDVILIGVMTFLPLVGAIVELGLWIWSLVLAINMPFDFFMLVYYIALAFYVFTKIIPTILSLFERRR